MLSKKLPASGTTSKKLILATIFTFLVSVCGGSVQNAFGQKTADKTKKTVIASNKAKPDKKTETIVETPAKTAIASRIEVKTGDTPPLITLVVGQVTTIKLPEPPLQIAGDKVGLNINESNENSVNKNVYIIPTKAGIRRNLIIELASGKVEFEIQSIAVENGKTAIFTREVDVKTVVEEKQQRTLEGEVKNLKEALAQKEREMAATSDRIAQAEKTAQLPELRLQTEMLLAMAKTKKGRGAASSNKEWEVTELYSTKSTDGTRTMSVFEITYRGKENGKFLEVKSDSGARVFWQPETRAAGSQSDGIQLKRGDRIKIAVIEFAGQPASRGLVFVAEGDVVKF